MATLKYSVSYKTMVPSDPSAEKAYYATLQSSDKSLLDALCEHISSHSSKYNRSDIRGVLDETIDCMKEMLLNGDIVNLGDEFGSFRLTIRCRPMTQDAMDDNDGYYSPDYIRKVNVVWNRGTAFRNLRVDDFSFTEVPTKREQGEDMAEKRSSRVSKK